MLLVGVKCEMCARGISTSYLTTANGTVSACPGCIDTFLFRHQESFGNMDECRYCDAPAGSGGICSPCNNQLLESMTPMGRDHGVSPPFPGDQKKLPVFPGGSQ